MKGLFDSDVATHGAEMGIDFEALFRAMTKKSVIMIDGGFCHYHLRRDGQCTVHVLLSNRRGAGSEMLLQLKQIAKNASGFLQAKCPADLESNVWYAARGFVLHATEESKTGRKLNVWRMTV